MIKSPKGLIVMMIAETAEGNPQIVEFIRYSEQREMSHGVVTFNYGTPTVSIAEKHQLILAQAPSILAILQQYAHSPDFLVREIWIATAITVAGIVPNGRPFLATTICGVGNPSELTREEKVAILQAMGYDTPTGRNIRGMVIGKDSGVDLSLVGLGEGFLSPFVSSDMIPSFFISRYLHPGAFSMTGIYPFVEFAFNSTTGIFIPEAKVSSFISLYCVYAKVSRPTYLGPLSDIFIFPKLQDARVFSINRN